MSSPYKGVAVETNTGDANVETTINGNVPEGMENMETTKEIRIIRRPNKTGGQSPRKNGDGQSNGEFKVQHQKLLNSKNSKKSRSGTGRGLPKKGGAGGKGTWGQPGDELYEDGNCRDHNDPNYDSEENTDEIVMKKIEPVVNEAELKQIVDPIIHEYFEHGDTSEVEASFDDVHFGNKRHKILEMSVNIALDHKEAQREMTSVLISDLYGNLLNNDDVSKGFDEILDSLADLRLDTPDAPTVVGKFIARAIADDCLPPKYVQQLSKSDIGCPHKKEALNKAEILLSQKHGIVRLDNIWGTGGGIRPVKALIKRMNLLLKEYLSSGDIPEATRCLQELEVPHFHHELVFEATVMVLEDTTLRSEDRMCALLKSLSESIIITPEQFDQGFRRVLDEMAEISVDVPEAPVYLERFAEKCLKAKFFPTELFKDLPQRGRKRFVSEGDGGRVKEHH